ncbi:MAG TPA: DUF4870 domain-containing protein [Candidatus Paceibacterota bacterium]|nr:DUF4870 domain-containing protein [Candidatus Paceibacterota bacterium]
MNNTTGQGAAAGAEMHGSEKKVNVMAIFAYLGILIVIPFLTDAKGDPFVKYHIKQGLALLIFEAIGWVIGMIPFLGWLVVWIFSVISVVLIVMGVVNVVNGQEKELPLVGRYAKNFSF